MRDSREGPFLEVAWLRAKMAAGEVKSVLFVCLGERGEGRGGSFSVLLPPLFGWGAGRGCRKRGEAGGAVLPRGVVVGLFRPARGGSAGVGLPGKRAVSMSFPLSL